MDDPALGAAEHAAALRGLQRVHRITGTVGRLWRPIEHLLKTEGLKELSVMDVGCGDGWMLRQLGDCARQRGYKLHLVGCDFSARALELCGAAFTQADVPIELHQVDVLQHALPGPADVVINSLFLHHFADEDVVSILEQLAAQAGRLLLIEDLQRSRLGYALCWLGVHMLTRCRVVHVDGPLSVKAAFSLSEARELLDRAGLREARISCHWPERFVITWENTKRTVTAHAASERGSHAG